MRLPPSGKKPGKRPHLVHVLAVKLLYGRVPGIKRLGNGKLLVTVRELAADIRCTGPELKRRMRRLEEWGVIKKIDMDKHTALLHMTKPLGWEDGDGV